jgi:hypothetical protein
MSNGGGLHAATREERGTVVPGTGGEPREIDVTTPSVARMYDYYLGGKDNYAADREAARIVLGAAPDVPLAALENREFLKRAVRYLAAERGVSQFVDIGPGLPTQGNVHQLVHQHNPGARVAYIDNDASVHVHGRALLDGVPGVTLLAGDLREPGAILAAPGLTALIDFSHPVALLMTLVLHFVPSGDDPYGVMAQYGEAMCPGSFLVISHVTGDDREPGTLAASAAYENASAPLIMRTRAQVQGFFTGFDLIDPGIVFLSQWRPGGEYHAQGGTRWAYCGVGEKLAK